MLSAGTRWQEIVSDRLFIGHVIDFFALLDERWHRDSSRIHDNPEHFITYPQWISPARHKRSHEGSKVMLTASSVVLRMRIFLVVHQRFIVLYIVTFVVRWLVNQTF